MKKFAIQSTVALRNVTLGTLVLVFLVASAAAQTPAPVTTTSGGTTGTIPIFTSNTNVENSVIYQASGHVGIGTTSPSQPLQVNGTIYGNAGTNNSIVIGSDTSPSNAGYTFVGNNGYWGLRTATNESFGLDVYNGGSPINALTVLQGGSVGIGTTGPGSLLDVHGPAQIGIDNWDTQVSSPVQVLRLYANGISAVAPYSAFNFNTVAGYSVSNKLEINSWDYITGGTAALFTLQGNGNVGIGTTSPQALLDVNGALRISGSGAGLTFPDGTSLNSAASLNQLGLTGGGTPAITQANGNVGIGTTSPQDKLDISGSPNSWTTVAGMQLSDTAGNPASRNWAIFNGASGYGNLDFYVGGSAGATPNNATSVMTIKSNGNVGIGTTTPQAQLDVNGVVKISGSGAGLTFPDGTIQSTAYIGTCPSTGGDYAESVDVEGDKKSYEPGDVMAIDPDHPGHFLMSSAPYSSLVAGIYSTKPGYVGRRQTGNPKLSTTEIPMAMVGIVPTKATTENGPIKIGDLLVTSSKPGYVMRGTDHDKMTGTIVGKALAGLKSNTGVIEVLVSLQ